MVSMCITPAMLHAVDIHWTGATGDGQWFNTANWNPAQVPTSEDYVVINNTAVSAHVTTPATAATIRMTTTGGHVPSLYVQNDLTLTNKLQLGLAGTSAGGQVIVDAGIFSAPVFQLNEANNNYPATPCDLFQNGGSLQFNSFSTDRNGSFRQSSGMARFGNALLGEGSAGDAGRGGLYLSGPQSVTTVTNMLYYRGYREVKLVDEARLDVRRSFRWTAGGRADYAQIKLVVDNSTLTVGDDLILTSGHTARTTGSVFAQTNGVVQIAGNLSLEAKDILLQFQLLNPALSIGGNLAAADYAKNFKGFQDNGSVIVAKDAYLCNNFWGSSTSLEQMFYRMKDGTLTIGGNAYVGYTSASAFYQDGGCVTVSNSLSIGMGRADRINAVITNAPALYQIKNNGILNVIGKLQVGGTVDKLNTNTARFEVIGPNTITAGSLDVRRIVSASPRQPGTLSFFIDKDGAMDPIHVAGAVRFDAGTFVHVEAPRGGLPAQTYTLIKWEGATTNSGLALDPETNTKIWKDFKVDATTKTVTVRYVPYASLILVR